MKVPVCQMCGDIIKKTPSSRGHDFAKRKFCSRNCNTSYQKENGTGWHKKHETQL